MSTYTSADPVPIEPFIPITRLESSLKRRHDNLLLALDKAKKAKSWDLVNEALKDDLSEAIKYERERGQPWP